MKIRNLCLVLALGLWTASAQAETSGEEAAGVGVGAAVGAAAGGPPGAIVGAALGGWLGDAFHRRSERSDRLAVSLSASREDVDRLQQNLVSLSDDNAALAAEIERLDASGDADLLTLLNAGIEMDLLFRTAEHALSDGVGGRLHALAVALQPMENVRVRLDGFADERGDADYNQELSRLRAEAVRDVLVAAGVSETRIEVNAHGESDSPDDSIDSYALERRVSLTLFVDESPSFAATP